MCLGKIIQSNEKIEDHILTAEKDIMVYKIMKNLYDNTYKSPFKTYIYHDLKLQPQVNLNPLPVFYKDKNDYYEVHQGYHSFPDMISAKKEKADPYYDSSNEIVPFIIPKGTKYIEGMFEDIPSIVSETIYMKLEE